MNFLIMSEEGWFFKWLSHVDSKIGLFNDNCPQVVPEGGRSYLVYLRKFLTYHFGDIFLTLAEPNYIRVEELGDPDLISEITNDERVVCSECPFNRANVDDNDAIPFKCSPIHNGAGHISVVVGLQRNTINYPIT